MKINKKEEIQEFNKIKKIIQSRDYLYALEKLEEFLKKYPNNLYAKTALGTTLMNLEDYEGAKIVLQSILNTKNHNYAQTSLLQIYIEEEKYEKAYVICKELLRSEKNNEKMMKTLESINCFLIKQLDLPLPVNFNDLSYREKQILSYDEKLSKKVVAKYFNQNKNVDCYFNENINIDDLYKDVKEVLKTNEVKPTPSLTAIDVYYFLYPNIGKVNEKKSNCLKVVTNKNNDEILTLLPVSNTNLRDHNAVFFLKEEKEEKINQNIKVKTGLERFNSRFPNYNNK